MTEEEQLVITDITDKFPEFRVIWEKYLQDEINDEEDEEFISLYTFASEFSEYIIGLYYKNDTLLLKKAFSEIENLCVTGSDYISNTAYVGFVEGVLMLRSHKKIPLNAFDEWLGERSKKFWYDMHDFFTKG